MLQRRSRLVEPVSKNSCHHLANLSQIHRSASDAVVPTRRVTLQSATDVCAGAHVWSAGGRLWFVKISAALLIRAGLQDSPRRVTLDF